MYKPYYDRRTAEYIDAYKRVRTVVDDLSGHPHLNRVTRRPYQRATEAGADFIVFGDSPDIGYKPSQDDIALMPDQIEDYAVACALKYLPRAIGQMEFCRFVVQAGLLEEGLSITGDGVNFLPYDQ